MSEDAVYKNNFINTDMLIRRTTKDDIEALMNISRLSFPDSLRWSGPKCQARKWWKYMIAAQFSETWVCQYKGQVVGFIMLTTDPKQHKKEKSKLRPSPATLLCTFAMHPWLLVTRIVERAFSINDTYVALNDVKSLAHKPLWPESSAVLPKMRNRGLGTRMMNFCEQRARELGCDSIKFCIKRKNRGSIRLHERLGFIRTAQNKNYYMYTKLLSEQKGWEKTA